MTYWNMGSIRNLFAATPGRQPGRALLASARPQDVRPCSGCCARAVRAARRTRAPQGRRGRPAVGSGRSSHARLRQPAYAVCLRPRAQPALRRRLACCKVPGRRGRVTRHARPTAHTLRMGGRPATRSSLPAHARSAGQRRRQRLHSGGNASLPRT